MAAPVRRPQGLELARRINSAWTQRIPNENTGMCRQVASRRIARYPYNRAADVTSRDVQIPNVNPRPVISWSGVRLPPGAHSRSPPFRPSRLRVAGISSSPTPDPTADPTARRAAVPGGISPVARRTALAGRAGGPDERAGARSVDRYLRAERRRGRLCGGHADLAVCVSAARSVLLDRAGHLSSVAKPAGAERRPGRRPEPEHFPAATRTTSPPAALGGHGPAVPLPGSPAGASPRAATSSGMFAVAKVWTSTTL